MDYIKIKIPGCIIELTVEEFITLMFNQPEIWQAALERNKKLKEYQGKVCRCNYSRKPGRYE